MDRMPAEAGSPWKNVQDAMEKFVSGVGKVVIGKERAVELLFLAFLCEGHVLIEDVPGVGKTRLARAAAKAMGLSFKRIQCTPDLLPSDVTGVEYFNQKRSEFEYRPGPIMANIVLVDEINRALPRTQSCLLECMQEKQVTVDRESIPLPRPFLLLATQNPIELEGTFPLPEAQLDRFLMNIRLGYPSAEDEDAILRDLQQADPEDDLQRLVDPQKIACLQRNCREIFIEPSIRQYIVALCRMTRQHEDVRLGVSPRAALALQAASQALAASRGRGYVLPDDIQILAEPVLAHRLLLKTEARLTGRTERNIIEDSLQRLPVPV